MRVSSRPGILAALALAAAVGPLLAPLAAAAASSPTVTFTGGCGLLGVGASSQPSTGSVKISANSSVSFVNHLNSSAQLFVNGSSQASLNPDYQVKVSFSSSASVSLVPSCLLGTGGAGTVSVKVSSPTPGSPTGPAPTTGTPTHASPTAKPSATSSPSAARPSLTPSGVPSGLVPSLGQSGLAGPSGAAIAAGPTDPASGSPILAVGAATPASSGHQGPDRLLVVISAVCIIGVTIALIRAIVAQRAIRVVAA